MGNPHLSQRCTTSRRHDVTTLGMMVTPALAEASGPASRSSSTTTELTGQRSCGWTRDDRNTEGLRARQPRYADERVKKALHAAHSSVKIEKIYVICIGTARARQRCQHVGTASSLTISGPARTSQLASHLEGPKTTPSNWSRSSGSPCGATARVIAVRSVYAAR